MVDKAFEVAHFFNISPDEVMNLPFDRFILYYRQAERISKLESNQT